MQRYVFLKHSEGLEDKTVARGDGLLDAEQPSAPFTLGHSCSTEITDLDCFEGELCGQADPNFHGLFVDHVARNDL